MTPEKRSENARKAALARWGKDQKSDLSKPSKSVYTEQNLTDAKQSEALEMLLYVIRRKQQAQDRKTRLQGNRLNENAGVEEMMLGGAIIEFDKLIKWISDRHPGAADDAKMLNV